MSFSSAAAAAAATPRAAEGDYEEDEEQCEGLLPETSHPMEELEMLAAAADEISQRLALLLDVLSK